MVETQKKTETLSRLHSISKQLDNLIRSKKEEVTSELNGVKVGVKEFKNWEDVKSEISQKVNQELDGFKAKKEDLKKLIDFKFYLRKKIDETNFKCGINNLLNKQALIESHKGQMQSMINSLVNSSDRKYSGSNYVEAKDIVDYISNVSDTLEMIVDGSKKVDLINSNFPVVLVSIDENYKNEIKKEIKSFEKDILTIKNEIASLNSKTKISFEISKEIADELAI